MTTAEDSYSDDGGLGPRTVISSTVTDALGPIAAGSGDQHNYFAGPPPRRRRAPLPLDDEDHESGMVQMFVEPPGLDRARAILNYDRTVLLRGEPESGGTARPSSS